MQAEEQPQIILVTPPAPDPQKFGDVLSGVLDKVEIACLRLSLAAQDADRLGRMADLCRGIAHARDIAVVIDDHFLVASRHGLDGVHLKDGARLIRKARAELGADAIVGAFCGTTRHDGMNAGEAGADYVAFGPIGPTGLGDGILAERALFEWWSEMIEVPIIAERGLTRELVQDFAGVTDFFAIGEEIWASDDPAGALMDLTAPLR